MKEIESLKPRAFPVPFPNVPFYLVGCNVAREIVPDFTGCQMLGAAFRITTSYAHVLIHRFSQRLIYGADRKSPQNRALMIGRLMTCDLHAVIS
jgi:hypothetical protein